MKTTFRILTVIATLAFFTNCSDSSDDGGGEQNGSCFQSLLSVTEDYSNILQAYQLNPNETNCNSLKQASIQLINAYGNCEEYLQDIGNAELEAAAQAWKDIDCSQN
ncbi:hypothetical protein APS56_00020 [Pseudalgibacter alginicilyticus]|uniref:Uncharacterized protein n=1 Tax=Pseudalgibacter alginicilyticus TaxID=1736674 RepID=A0A0P0CTK8_9FLAO|nr:hypothetical protein [Pseudalgibacter alginicilyticus]ALJ03631.1 hypothetical protein APS56_00020 [Pseudalgibacter alginicilyticus]